ncbi:MAG: MarR family transcriptional regulator [Hyphomicrobiales bacterium]|nr:MarR family transcriptional regulator [Hyphomicrobiales bacterium]
MVKRRRDAAAGGVKMPAAGEGKRGASGHLAYLLRQVNAAIRLKLERAFAEVDITQPQFATLTMLAAYPLLSGAELARLTLLTPQTVNVIVRNLVKRGAIAKRADAVHGRILRLELTPAGRRLLARCRVHADRIEAEMAAGLSRADERVVRGWLARVGRGLPDEA